MGDIKKNKQVVKELDKMFSLFSGAHLYFYVWKYLQKEEYDKHFKYNNIFWSATLSSLHYSWLSALSKLYEKSTYSKTNKVISVFSLVESQLDKKRKNMVENYLLKHSNTIKNLKIRRDNEFAHNNKEHLLNPKNIESKNPIKYKDVEALLDDTPDILSNLHPDSNVRYSYFGFKKNCQDGVEYFMKQLDFFFNEKEKHKEKFIKGEIDDITFPPTN